MSEDFEFNQGDEPAIRRAPPEGRSIDAFPCPFCGDIQLLISDTDLGIDTERVEVYCDNHYCEAREMVILIKRGAGCHQRADVRALRAVDEGTEQEQEADGAIFARDAEGNVESRAWSYNKRNRSRSQGERDNEVLERRRRLTRFNLQPLSEDDE